MTSVGAADDMGSGFISLVMAGTDIWSIRFELVELVVDTTESGGVLCDPDTKLSYQLIGGNGD